MRQKRRTRRGPLVRCRPGWLAALAGGLVALAATPAIAAQGADLARCVQEVREAGLLGPQTNPGQANYILGTKGNDTFVTTGGVDVICGFAGEDRVLTPSELSGDDIFLGAPGDDFVQLQTGGTFNGGGGNDRVLRLNGGTFNGGEGKDLVFDLFGGTFNGGEGNDRVLRLNGGTFNGGEGNDLVVFDLFGGTFNGGEGNDAVLSLFGGTFNGGPGCDVVASQHGGTFNPGDESGC